MEKKLDFTKEAREQIDRITQGEEKKYFRITVKGGGCSGFKYSFGFEEKSNNDDILFDMILKPIKEKFAPSK